jgi:methylthioribose-1-phosphate isomerase
MNSTTHLTVQALEWKGSYLRILDQRQLPDSVVYSDYTDAIGVAHAIKTMQVRGAPAIGIAAAYGIVLSIKQHYMSTNLNWRKQVQADSQRLADSRPTAVNLFWALELMRKTLAEINDNFLAVLEALAIKIHADDVAANYKMGELGADILGQCKGVMTHCNAGALATGGYGTALGVIRSAYQRGLTKIYAGETRPWLQGARLTVWELAQDGIPSTLIADSAAAWLMASGAIDWIIVGADRIAANGDVANKIGTYSLAVLAKQHGVKMMVVAPTSTLDITIASGADIEIEQRLQSELLPACYQNGDSIVTAWNPVFDVTPAYLITVIVTERGVILNPATTGVSNCLQ